MRLFDWFFDVAEDFDAALDWQETDDLLLDAHTEMGPAHWPVPEPLAAARP
jgi:hypothetical protein